MEISVRDSISSFIVHCRVKNLDPKSIKFYKIHLYNFLEFLEIKKKEVSISKITPPLLREFILYLQNEKQQRYRKEKGISASGVNRHIKVLKIFFKFLVREGIIEENPARNISMIRTGNKRIETFTPSQVLRMLEVARRNRSFTGLRDYLLIHILYDTGLRISELLNLRLQDIDFENRTFHVVGKGKKERLVPFGRMSFEILKEYLEVKRSIFGENEYVFLTRDGKRLSRRQASKNIERIGRRAGIKGVRISPHTFRHSFAKNYLLNGGDVFSLKEILGHSDLETVQIYVNMNQEDIINQYNKYNPGDKLIISELLKAEPVD
jgi:integrase/recombinase XerD